MTPDLERAIFEAIAELSTIPFAPQDPAQQKVLMKQLAAFADRPDAIRWTVAQAVARWTRWCGMAELRGIYCNRFKPADGIEADCVETHGLTPTDNESAYEFEHPGLVSKSSALPEVLWHPPSKKIH